MIKGRTWLYGSVFCFGILARQAHAVPTDPAPGEEEQNKSRLATQYYKIFQNKWLESRSDSPSAKALPYEREPLAAASADRDGKIALCKSNRRDQETETDFANCQIAAIRSFASAISMKDMGLIDALTGSISAVAIDTDEKRLTSQQALGMYALLNYVFTGIFAQLFDAYDAQMGTDLAEEYRGRLSQAYRQASRLNPIPVAEPPFDEGAEVKALNVLSKAQDNCELRRDTESATAYAECLLAAERRFADLVKMRDLALYISYDAALRAAASETDQVKLTASQFVLVSEALAEFYDTQFNKELSDYHELLARPAITAYAARFFANYVSVAGLYPDDAKAFLDPKLLTQAERLQFEALEKCTERDVSNLTEVLKLECNFTAYRNLALAAKFRDTRLLEAFINAMRHVAADADAGRLTWWERDAIYKALFRTYTRDYRRIQDTFDVSSNQPLVTRYVTNFDNSYISAGGGSSDSGPPWDVDSIPAAMAVRDNASAVCFSRRAELKTAVAFWDCRISAERVYAISTHLKNILLLEKEMAAVRSAAADTDLGKITDEQLNSVAIAMGLAYEAMENEDLLYWRQQQLKTEFSK